MRDIRRTLGVLAAPLLLVFALAKVAKVAGWGAALADLAGLTVGLLGAVALLSLGRSRGWPRGARRVRVYGSGRDPIPVHAGARTPQDVEISEAELNGTVVELEMGDVGSAIAPARRPRGAATAPRHRQLHECADDSLTPPGPPRASPTGWSGSSSSSARPRAPPAPAPAPAPATPYPRPEVTTGDHLRGEPHPASHGAGDRHPVGPTPARAPARGPGAPRTGTPARTRPRDRPLAPPAEPGHGPDAGGADDRAGPDRRPGAQGRARPPALPRRPHRGLRPGRRNARRLGGRRPRRPSVARRAEPDRPARGLRPTPHRPPSPHARVTPPPDRLPPDQLPGSQAA